MIFFIRHKTGIIFLFGYKNILWIISTMKVRFFEVFGVVAMSVSDHLRLVTTQCIPPMLGKSYDYLSNSIYLPLSVF